MIVLGVDPGYANFGLGLVRRYKNGRFKVLDHACITTSPKSKESDRFAKIAKGFNAMLGSRKDIEIVVIEKIFFARNRSSALKVAEIIGVVKHLCIENETPHTEIMPNKVKFQIDAGGFGKSAVKLRVKHITNQNFKTDHETDAVAIAIAHMKGLDQQES